MCHTVWQQHSSCQFNSRHLYLLSVLSQQHFMWSCHDLHIHSRSDLKVFSFSSSVHWDLNSNLCCCSFFCQHYLSQLSNRWSMQFFNHLSVLWMAEEETNTIRECLSILRIITEEHEVSDCISKAWPSSVWHVWWVRPQCHHLLKASSVKWQQWRQKRQWWQQDSDNNKTVKSKGDDMSRDNNIAAVRLAIVTICV